MKTFLVLLASSLLGFSLADPGTVLPAPIDEYGADGGQTNLVRIELEKFDDGSITTARLRVTEPFFGKNPPFTVKFNIPGVHCERDTLHVKRNCKKTGNQPITCKPVGCPERQAGTAGDTIDVTVSFEYSFTEPDPKFTQKKETQVVKRGVKSCGTCSGQGDPHIKTLDNATFDFHSPGVFTFFESGSFKVFAFQDNCKNVLNWEQIPSCFNGAAVVFGDSVLRFFLVDGKLEAARASADDELTWLKVKKLAGETDGYRVFILADASSYVDVTVGQWWQQDYKFVNVAVQAGSYFQTDNVRGLVGNWNGDPSDDDQDKETLERLYKAPDLTDTIFTCDDCTKFFTPASKNDAIGMNLTQELPLLHQGFDAITITDVKKFQPDITKPPEKIRQRRSLKDIEAVKAKATSMCKKVIHSIPHCGEIVENQDFSVQSCISDATLLGSLGVVEAFKIAYLRNCRNTLDALIESQSCQSKRTKILKQQRQELLFGDLSQCKDACNARGRCLQAGCACDKGFTGMACEISCSSLV